MSAPAPVPGPLPDPGWYPDPWCLSPWRWWDGLAWSSQVFPEPFSPPPPPDPSPAPAALSTSAGTGLPLPPPGAQPLLPGSLLLPPPPGAGLLARQPSAGHDGAGILGGGIALVGTGIGIAASALVSALLLVTLPISFHVGRSPYGMAASELALWLGWVGACVIASRKHGTGSLAQDYGLAWPRPVDLARGIGIGFAGRMAAGIVASVLASAGVAMLSSPATVAFGSAVGAARDSVIGLTRTLASHGAALDGVTPHGTAEWVTLLAITCIGAPFVEELFFRGLVQGVLIRRLGTGVGLVLTAAIFAAGHITSEGLTAPFVLFPMGLLLGWLRLTTKSLASGMVAHATFNAVAVLLLASSSTLLVH